MAVITRVELVDDVDGSPGSETITFGLDGRQYEIDLSERNAELLRDAFAKYIYAGRRIGGRARSAQLRTPSTNGNGTKTQVDVEQRKAVRQWGIANGYPVGLKGRIKEEVYEAYQAAHAEKR